MWPLKKVAVQEVQPVQPREIGEPVKEIVRIMAENPFRFDGYAIMPGSNQHGLLIDRFTDEVIRFGSCFEWLVCGHLKAQWLTDDEDAALFDAMTIVCRHTDAVHKEYKAYRKQHESKAERDRVMGVYCTKGNT